MRSVDAEVPRAPHALGAVAWTVIVGGLLAIRVGNHDLGAQASPLLRLLFPAMLVCMDLATFVVALHLARRFPLGRSQPVAHLGPHAIAALGYFGLHYAIDGLLLRQVDPAVAAAHDPWPEAFVWDMVGYAMWSAVAHAIEYARRYRAHRAAALLLSAEVAEMGRQRAEAELRALKAELNPRFLSEALGTVRDQAASDVVAAELTLAELSQMARSTLARFATNTLTLEEEVEGLEPFLAIQRARFGDRLVVTSELDQATYDAVVPHMLLQPLVDHVAARTLARGETAHVRITAARSGSTENTLDIVVRGPPQAPFDATGQALTNVRARIRELFGDRGRLDVDAEAGVIYIALPWRNESDADAGSVAPAAIEVQQGRTRRSNVAFLLAPWFIAVTVKAAERARVIPLANGAQSPVGGAIVEGLHAATLTTAMLYVAIRFAFHSEQVSWRRHLIAASAFGVANALGKVVMISLLGAPYPPIPPGRLVGAVIVGAFTYGLLTAAVQAVAYARRDRGTLATSLRLRADLAEAGRRRAEAELRALKAQLNPHFFSNALTVVAGLLHSDAAAAQRVVAQIDALLAGAAARLQTQEVTLREEIEGLEPFIAVERARFGKRLAVRLEIEETALPARVPHMILQPLLENAVKHGVGSERGGEIVVSGRRSGGRLELSVRDNGAGIRESREPWQISGGGVGLANTRTRLAELYGREASFDLETVSDSDASGVAVARGTIAKLSLPWRA